MVVLIRCRRHSDDSSKKLCKIGENKCESEKGGQWSSSPGAVDLVKWKCKWKIGESNCGAIVKVKEEQWSLSSDDLVNTRAKGKLENECGAIVKVKEEHWLCSSGAVGLVDGK